MKKILKILLIVLSLVGLFMVSLALSSYPREHKREMNIVYTPTDGQNPIIYVPNIFIETNIKYLIKTHAAEIVDTSKYVFSKLLSLGLLNNIKSYSVTFKSKPTTNLSDIKLLLNLTVSNQSMDCTYKNLDGTEVKLWSSGSTSNCTISLGKTIVYQLKTPIYIFARDEGILLCFGNTLNSSIPIVTYLSREKQFSNFGITVSLPHTFINSYFSSYPLSFANVAGTGYSTSLESSTIKNENTTIMNFTTKINYTHPDSSFAVAINLLAKIKRDNNQITSVSGYSYDQGSYSSVQRIIIDDLISHLKSSINTNILNKRLVALYQTDTLGIETVPFYFKRVVLNNSEIINYNDNALFFISI